MQRRQLNPLHPKFSAGLHINEIVAAIGFDGFTIFGFVTDNAIRQSIAEIARNVKLIIQLNFFSEKQLSVQKSRNG
jgi:hypothetical protein